MEMASTRDHQMKPFVIRMAVWGWCGRRVWEGDEGVGLLSPLFGVVGGW